MYHTLTVMKLQLTCDLISLIFTCEEFNYGMLKQLTLDPIQNRKQNLDQIQ